MPAACWVCVRGEGPPYSLARVLPENGPPLALARIQQGTRSPPLPLLLLSSHARWRGPGPGLGSAQPSGPQPRRSRPAGPGELRPPPPPPPPPCAPPSLLPFRARLQAGWEEISPEFPFHTSRLNFLSVSRPLAVCSFSCHRKCQAKVRGRGPPRGLSD